MSKHDMNEREKLVMTELVALLLLLWLGFLVHRSPRFAGSQSGLRLSSRLPIRMFAIWVSEPIGGWTPLRAAITPAMKVEATAPMPGSRTPSLPVAGAICRAVMAPW